MSKRIRARARARGSSSFQPAKQLENPKQFTEAELKETKAWLRNAAEEEAKREAAQKAALAQRIRILRQKLNREAKGKGCTDNRRKEIEGELEDLKGPENQECGTGEPKHPSSRPSARELGFETDAPSVDEILEAVTIQRGLRSKKSHLIFAKLDPVGWASDSLITKKEQRKTKKGANRERFDPESVELPFQSEKFIWAWATWVKLRKKIGCPLTRTATSQQLSKLRAMGEARAIAAIEHSIRWGQIIKREALRDPKTGRTRERIEFGDIKEIKFSKLDRVIAEHYFKSQKLKKPLCELSVDNASVELRKLKLEISPRAFELALRRLCLAG